MATFYKQKSVQMVQASTCCACVVRLLPLHFWSTFRSSAARAVRSTIAWPIDPVTVIFSTFFSLRRPKGKNTTVYDFVYQPPLGRFSKLDCSTAKRVPIPNGTSSESSRRDVPSPTFLAPTLLTLFQLWRYRPWKLAQGGVRSIVEYRICFFLGRTNIFCGEGTFLDTVASGDCSCLGLRLRLRRRAEGEERDSTEVFFVFRVHLRLWLTLLQRPSLSRLPKATPVLRLDKRVSGPGIHSCLANAMEGCINR